MKRRKFEVVELKNGNKATILYINNNKYHIEEVDSNGNSLGFNDITDNEIKKVIYTKNI